MTSRIGPYEIRGELGRGAMAVVWRAWDASLEREVAIKEPKIDDSLASEVRDELATRFIREGKTAGQLNHPGIVTIYHAGIIDGRPIIAMELIEGQTLSSVLSRGALSASAAASITSQLLEALVYAHERGVVHRDIKPDNVFVTDDGRVKLTDFGIAHVGAGTALTQAGTVMGTPGYMAPEQVRGETVDPRADLFSVGVMLYEMLTGRNPFTADGAHPTTIMYRVLNEDLPDVRAALTDVPEPLAALVTVATSKDAAARFASAEEMQTALRDSQVSVSRKPGRPGQPRPRQSKPASEDQDFFDTDVTGDRPRSRRRGPVTAAITLVLLLVLGICGRTSAGDQESAWSVRQTGFAEPLYSAHFIDDTTGWVVGWGGVILHTADGGDSWAAQWSGVRTTLRSVTFANESLGWAVGDFGTVLRTVDGGETWGIEDSGTIEWLTGLDFVGPSDGWAVGRRGKILRSTDGGMTWTSFSPVTLQELKAVDFVDARSGWAVGDGGMILHTADGGDSWEAQLSGRTESLTDVHFIDDSTGWVVGHWGTVLRTSNGGATWALQDLGSSTWLSSVHFADRDTGWLTGWGKRVFKTDDGGATWVRQSSGLAGWLNSVHFSQTGSGWAVGDGGTVKVTNQGP